MKRRILSLLLIVFAFVFVGCSDVDALGVALNQDNYENFELTMVMDIEAPNFENTVTMKLVTDGVDTHLETSTEGMKLEMIFFERNNTYYFAIKSILLGYNTGWTVEEVKAAKDLIEIEENMDIFPKLKPNDFEKDDEGYYVIKEEKIDEYIENILDEMKDVLEEIINVKEEYPFEDFYLKFKVNKDRLTEVKHGFVLKVDDEELRIDSDIKIENIGKAKVNLPSAVKKQIKE